MGLELVLVFGLETGWVIAMVSEYASALVLGLELELELGPASQLVRELELASGLVLGLALALASASVMVFLERLASGSVGRVERVQSQHCCSAC